MERNKTVKKLENNRGITLISLIITIIILVILVGIGLKLIIDGNVVGSAKDSVNKANNRVGLEQNILDEAMGEWNNNDYDISDIKCPHRWRDWTIINSNEKSRTCTVCDITQTLKITDNYYATITNCIGKGLDNYKIYGNSVQNETPSPSTPVEIQSVGDYDETTGKYKIPVKISGINLFNDKTSLTNIGTAYLGISTEYFEKDNYTLQIKLKENKNIPSGAYFGFIFDDKKAAWLINNGNLVALYNGLVSLDLNTITVNGVACYPAKQEVWDSITDAFEIKLIKGRYDINSIPDYEPYQEPITTNIYLDEPLRKIGSYEDYIDFKEKKVVRKIYKQQILSSFNWATYNLSIANTNNFKYKGVGTYNLLANRGVAKTGQMKFSNSNYNRIELYYEYFGVAQGDLDGVKAKLQGFENSGNPLTIYYPTNEIPAQPIELPTIQTTYGTTTIEVDTSVKPSKIEIE